MKGSRARNMSGSLLDQHEIGGIRGNVYLSHPPDVEGAWLKPGHPVLYTVLLPVPAVVAGIDRHRQGTSRFQALQSHLQCYGGCLRSGDDAAVTARQVAEVENDQADAVRHVAGQGLMAGANQFHPLSQPGPGQSAGGLVDGSPLDVECPYPAAWAHQLRKQQGVMAVAAGGVNGPVSLMQKSMHEEVRQDYRPAQQGYVRNDFGVHGGRG